MLTECMDIIENSLDREEIKKISRILYGLYDPFLLDQKIWTVIEEVFPTEVYKKIEHYKSSIVGHDIVNGLVLKNFPGEITIKYHFIKNYLNKFDEITTFELNIGTSRLDIGRVNGKSIAYEIKTELDSLEKLEKQLNDYSKVFEYIYVIIHPHHLEKVKKIVPQHCGIITYNLVDNSCKFTFRKKAEKNKNICTSEQLKTMTKKELDWVLKQFKSIVVPSNRAEKEKIICNNYHPQKVNTLFKKVLKRRYSTKWEYLCDKFVQILPIDIQVFYSTQADPYWIYYKNSSIV